MFQPALFLRRYYRLIWWVVFVLSALPAGLLAHDWLTGTLGANPLERLTRGSGLWAFNFLLLSLVITPLRRWLAMFMIALGASHGKRLADWNELVKLRRMLGLYAFAYAVLHFWFFLHLDLGWDFSLFADSLTEKPYVFAGMVALFLLVLLAATSFDAAISALKRNWKRLHRLAYVAALAAALHFLWMTKPGVHTPKFYATVLAVLLGYRLFSARGWLVARARDDGEVVPPRAPSSYDHSFPHSLAKEKR